MSNRTPRALSNEEFLVQFRTVVKRLDTHLRLIDEGQYHMRDDLATVLRTLLSRGNGDDGIRRFQSRFSLKQPKRDIYLSASEEPGVILSIGALPFANKIHKHVIQTVTVPDQLMLAVPLFVRSNAGVRRANWERVVTDYGNTFGAHLSTTVPAILDDVHYFGMSETDFGTYMLRSLGVMISSVCHELIHQIDQNNVAVTHQPYMAGLNIFTAMILYKDGKDDMHVGLMFESFEKEMPIMSYRNPVGEQLIYSITENQQHKLTVRH